MNLDPIELIAVQSLVKETEGVKWDDVKSAKKQYPRLTSAITATFDVIVKTKDEAVYNVPVVTRVEYTHPKPLLEDIIKELP